MSIAGLLNMSRLALLYVYGSVNSLAPCTRLLKETSARFKRAVGEVSSYYYGVLRNVVVGEKFRDWPMLPRQFGPRPAGNIGSPSLSSLAVIAHGENHQLVFHVR